MFAAVTDVMWTVGTIAVLIALAWIARRIDPHWVAKDGQAFTCRMQPIRLPGRASDDADRRSTLSEGRWRAGRATVSAGRVTVTIRGIAPGQRQMQSHPVIGRGTDPPRRSITFLLGGEPNYLLMIPASSPAVEVLDSLVGGDGRQSPGEVGE